MLPLKELEKTYLECRQDESFHQQLQADLKHYVGRPSPLYFAERLSSQVGGARIYLKREDLNHTGAHKINNTVGQARVAQRMGKTR
ncbi:MAG: tryptophan synthase subunit beta, partial [Gammaproteobacteria bacterium]